MMADFGALYYKNLPDNAVVCLMSPTASGKTELSFKLYETGRFELVSVDSALIYQDMNIGTAKPTYDELARYPHHLVDIITPTEHYSVANFVDDVAKLIEKIHARGKLPLLVGGTMMYYMALFDGISAVPETTPQIREQVGAWQRTDGNQALYDYLLKHDPKICQKLKASDTQRITRAVEVHLQTGQPMSVWQQLPKIALSQQPKWQWYGLVVMPDRAWLHERIATRLEVMWQMGFVQEVIDLLSKYPSLTPEMPSMRCVGYRQVLDFLLHFSKESGNLTDCIDIISQQKILLTKINTNLIKCTHIMHDKSCQDMKNKALYATRQLAKRQYTWLRQIVLMGVPTKTKTSLFTPSNNIKMLSFQSIKEVEQKLLSYYSL